VLLSEVHLPKGSFIVFDRGYVDYAQWERFTQDRINYHYCPIKIDNFLFGWLNM
jgi:hypothetical protein